MIRTMEICHNKFFSSDLLEKLFLNGNAGNLNEVNFNTIIKLLTVLKNNAKILEVYLR